jgi:hypothetical protein
MNQMSVRESIERLHGRGLMVDSTMRPGDKKSL